MMACREIERERGLIKMNATPGSERERAARNHTQQYACCRLPYHGAADVPREIAGGRREDRERRPAGQERETAESERERALRFELCVERHPGVGGDSNDCERRTNQHSSAYGAAGVPREIVCVGGERTEREGWVAGRE